jgi:hypothetical protein
LSLEEDSAAGATWLFPKLEGRICGCMDIVLEGLAFCSPELRSAGLMSGCLACIVILPSREVSDRLRATFEIWRFWSWFLWMTVRARDPPG